MPQNRAIHLVYAVSLLLHGLGGAWLASIEVERKKEPTVVEVRTVTKPKPKPPPEAPKPVLPPEPEAPAKPKAAPKPAPAAPAPVASPAAAVPDFGLSLGGMGAGGPGGIAVPVGQPGGGKTRQAAKTLEAPAIKAPAGGDTCAEPEVKAKALETPRPVYTEEARAAAIEGKVRVELTVDASGVVTGARVLEGLGHGLDESALEAARAWKFSPATRCGAPVASTFTVAVRFAL